MFKKIISISLIIFFNVAYAQEFYKIWGNNQAANVGHALQELPSGNILFMGITDSTGLMGVDIFKYSPQGDFISQKYIGDTSNINAEYMNHTRQQELILCGQVFGKSSNSKYFISKIDTNGQVIWKKISASTDKNELLEYIEETSDKGFIACGYTTQSDNNSNDFLLVKFDSSGKKEWENAYGFGKNDVAHTVHQTKEGGYIVSGDRQEGDSENYDNYLIKVDSLGEIEWDLIIGDEYNNGNQGLLIDADGNYLLYGEGSSERDLAFDILLCKVNPSGELLWAKNVGGNGTEAAFSLVQKNANEYLLAGYSNSYDPGKSINIFFGKIDSAGNSLGIKYFRQAEVGICYSMIAGVKDHYLLAGGSGNKYYCIKTTDTAFSDQFKTYTIPTNIPKKKNFNPLKIIPNPSTGHITIEGIENPEDASCVISNMNGKQMYTSLASKTLNLQFLPAGIYMFQMISTFGIFYQKILIIPH